MSFFKKYRDKQDGTIRFYDIKSTRIKFISILIFLACIVMIVIAIFPALWVCLASFKNIQEFRRTPTILPSKYDVSVFVKTWNDLHFLKYYFNSFVAVAGSVVSAVFFNGLLAYGLAILKPRGYKIVTGLVMWSLLIPATTSVVSLFVNITRVGLDGSFVPLWLAIGANAFYVLLFKEFFEQLPKELIEASTLDGCSNFKIFYMIVLPLSVSIVMVVAIFAVSAAWSDFLLPYLVLSNTEKVTVMVRLFQFRTNNTNDVDVLRAIVFSIIPPIILFTIFQKQITQSVVSAGIKG
ncbi:MAG: binding-protein-dependent transport system inner rane component [Caproiciproducens sp.]|nr:binding-protein-dependent transport system inner rane component [Caproiciproducens sp.]